MRSFRLRPLVSRLFVYTHRWLGMLLGALFVGWFVSGIVMMYARMPALETSERLSRLPAISPASIRVAPPAPADGDIARLVINTVETRPVYRITAKGRTQSIFADTGDAVPVVDAEQAMRIARAFDGSHHTLRYDARLTDADQWSFGVRGRMPLHRVDVDDEAGTVLYVTENTGEVVLKTTASGRLWGGAGAVMHWLYFTPFRRLSNVWAQSIIWLSIAGTVMCIIGIVWGLWRLAPMRGYRLRDHRQWSPYASWMRWHHYAGLIFGVVSITWAFSGAMSLDYPVDFRNQPPTPAQRTAVSRSPLRLEEVTVARMRAALDVLRPSFTPKELDVLQFQGEPYFIGARPPAPYDYAREVGSNDERNQRLERPEHLIVAALRPERGAFRRFPDDSMWTIGKAAMPDVPVRDAAWLTEYDAYYYDQYGNRPLPVLRVRYADDYGTWLYLEPGRGTITKQDRGGRMNRWLYHGLHSLDFPFLYRRRPLWDLVLIALSVGGLVLSASTLLPSWRRLARHVRHARRALAPARATTKAGTTKAAFGREHEAHEAN